MKFSPLSKISLKGLSCPLKNGFSLTEILIGLAIIGVIATFAVPKFKDTSDLKTQKENVKAAMAELVAAYGLYRMENRPDATVEPLDIAPYINYIRTTTLGSIDDVYTGGTRNCQWMPCKILNNGAAIWHYNGGSQQFGGTNKNNAIVFFIDPDGKVTDGGGGTTSGKSVQVFLYYDGKVRERSHVIANTANSGSSFGATSAITPPYWSWD